MQIMDIKAMSSYVQYEIIKCKQNVLNFTGLVSLIYYLLS